MLGFDPDLGLLPPPLDEELRSGLSGPEEAPGAAAAIVERWGRELIDAVIDRVVAVKFQVAHFETLGAAGWQALGALVRHAQRSGIVAIADAKVGDIESSASAYARALVGETPAPDGGRWVVLGADACTVNPYMGTDVLDAFAPWMARHGRGIFALVHTSNPSAPELQALRLADGRTVAEAAADMVQRWARLAGGHGPHAYGPVGAVVGGTYPEAVRRLRSRMEGVWMLLPGAGAQGADVEALGAAFDRDGLGALVSASRSVLGAWRTAGATGGATWPGMARAAVEDLVRRTNRARFRTGG